MQTIRIEGITRVEGHGKITIQLDDNGTVQDAHLHVLQFRGFEKFCEGRPFYEMPSLTARICGICPISHLLAGAKAADAIMGLRIPEDIAVIGCGNLHFDSSLRVSLSSIDQQSQMIGRRAAEVLLEIFKSKKPPTPRTIILEPALVARSSTNRNGTRP